MIGSPASTLPLLGAEWVAASAAMALLWAWQRRLRNASVLDPGWAGVVAALAIADARLGDGFAPRRAAVGFMIGSWGLRLLVHLLYDRVFGRAEGARAARLRARWGDRADARFFWIFQAHALLAVVFSLPALLASANGAPVFSRLELVAVGIWVVAFVGETTADNRKQPNDLFEGAIWIGCGLFAVSSSWGWAAMACPAIRAVQLTISPSALWLRKYRRAS